MAGAVSMLAGDHFGRPASRVHCAGLPAAPDPGPVAEWDASRLRACDHPVNRGDRSARVATSPATSVATTAQIFFPGNRSMGTCGNLGGNPRGAFFSCEHLTSMRRDGSKPAAPRPGGGEQPRDGRSGHRQPVQHARQHPKRSPSPHRDPAAGGSHLPIFPFVTKVLTQVLTSASTLASHARRRAPTARVSARLTSEYPS